MMKDKGRGECEGCNPKGWLRGPWQIIQGIIFCGNLNPMIVFD